MKFVFTILSVLIVILGIRTSSVWAVNRALSLDGDGDYIEFPAPPQWSGDTSFTVSFWMRYNPMPNRIWIMDIGTRSNPEYRNVHWLINPDGGTQFGFWLGAQNEFDISSYQGQWIFVSTVYDSASKNLKTYLNGNLTGNDNVPSTPVLQSNDMNIGLNASAGLGPESYFNGLIDEVRIWNIARAQEQIQTTMNTTLTGNEEGLVGYWNFDDGTANDLSPNDNNGVLHGDAQIVEAEDIVQGTFANLTSRDIGQLAIEGSTEISAGTYTVKAGGWDVWDAQDEFRFVYLELSGDFEAVVRVVSLEDVYEWTKAGLMARQNAEASSSYAFSLVTPRRGTALQWRVAAVARSMPNSDGTPYSALPMYLKLVRQENEFLSFRSKDGQEWEENHSLGQPSAISIEMTDPILLGLAVTSHVRGTLTTAVFDNFTINGWSVAGGAGVVISDKIANPGEQFTTSISVRLSEELQSFSFGFTFDPSVLEAISVKEGSNIGIASWEKPTIDNENGVIGDIRCSQTGEESIGKAGVLATVAFKAKEAGSTDLTFQNLRLLSPTGEEIKAQIKHGRVDVYPNGSISGIVLNSETDEPIRRAKVELSKDNFTIGGLSTYSADDGTYTLRGVPVGVFDVKASKNGYMSETILKVHVEGGKTIPDISIKLTSLRDFAR